MGQLRRFALGAMGLAMIAAIVSCRPSGSHDAGGAEPRVASIMPAGTDLLVGIGAADHLVAVSNYDDDRQGTAGKPKIGDYQSIDWEKLAPLHPQILITFYAPDRIPPAISQRCSDLGIRIFNVKLEQLDDIYREAAALGDAVGEAAKAREAIAALKAKLAAVQAHVVGLPRVKVVIVTGEGGLALAGPDTFLDELVTLAGGQNVGAAIGKRYGNVDREMLLSMAPDVVIQLIPDGDKTPQVLAQARQFWDSLPQLPAVKNHQIHFVTDWYAQQPGFHVGQLAERFADILHPRGQP